MALKAPESTSTGMQSKFLKEIAEPDTYPARVVQVIDLGLQPQRPYQGKEKPPRQTLRVTYETVDLFMKDTDGNELPESPRWFSEKIPLLPMSSERAKSTIRMKGYDPKNELEGDFSRILNRPCSILLGTYESNGQTRNGVNGVSPVMRGYVTPPLKNEPVLFMTDAPDLAVFDSLPDFIQEEITSNLQFKGSVLEAALANRNTTPAKEPAKEPVKEPVVTPQPAAEVTTDAEENPWS